MARRRVVVETIVDHSTICVQGSKYLRIKTIRGIPGCRNSRTSRILDLVRPGSRGSSDPEIRWISRLRESLSPWKNRNIREIGRSTNPRETRDARYFEDLEGSGRNPGVRESMNSRIRFGPNGDEKIWVWKVSCVFVVSWWVHLVSTYDALYDMQSPIETCKAPQNNIIESI